MWQLNKGAPSPEAKAAALKLPHAPMPECMATWFKDHVDAHLNRKLDMNALTAISRDANQPAQWKPFHAILLETLQERTAQDNQTSQLKKTFYSLNNTLAQQPTGIAKLINTFNPWAT